MEGTYEYECMRAELLGKEKPSREVFEVEQAKLRQQIESEELLVEETKVVDNDEEKLNSTGGKLDELNSVLSITQLKINKFKKACGSLTNLLRISEKGDHGSSDNIAPSGTTDQPTDANPAAEFKSSDDPSSSSTENRESVDPNNLSDPNEIKPIISNIAIAKKVSLDLSKKMSSHLGALDSLINKAENAQYSMSKQTKEMEKMAK